MADIATNLLGKKVVFRSDIQGGHDGLSGWKGRIVNVYLNPQGYVRYTVMMIERLKGRLYNTVTSNEIDIL